MARLLFNLVPSLMLAFSAAVLVIHAQPYDDAAVRALLMPSGCPAPCFLGIRPGLTTLADALRILQAHPWVGMVYPIHEPPTVIYWDWNGRQPAFFRPGMQPQMILSDDTVRRVKSILLDTTIPVAYAYLLLGESGQIDSGRSAAMQGEAFVSALYLDQATLIWTTVECPVTKRKFWESPMMVHLSSAVSTARRFGGIRRYC